MKGRTHVWYQFGPVCAFSSIFNLFYSFNPDSINFLIHLRLKIRVISAIEKPGFQTIFSVRI